MGSPYSLYNRDFTQLVLIAALIFRIFVKLLLTDREIDKVNWPVNIVVSMNYDFDICYDIRIKNFRSKLAIQVMLLSWRLKIVFPPNSSLRFSKLRYFDMFNITIFESAIS